MNLFTNILLYLIMICLIVVLKPELELDSFAK